MSGLVYTAYKHPHSFFAVAKEFLLATELENGVTLGATMGLIAEPSIAYYATVQLQERVVATAFSLSGPVLWVSAASPSAVMLIAQDIAHKKQLKQKLPQEICAAETTAQVLAAELSKLTQAKYRKSYSLRLYQAQGVHSIATVPGYLRLAGETDTPLVEQWAKAFNHEVAYGDEAGLLATAQKALREQRLFLWHTSEPVAMMWRSNPTPNTERVGMVYTPPQFRRRGFSAAINVAVAQTILDSGKQTVCLFADADNPVSNALYQKIGYRAVTEMSRYLLHCEEI